MQTSVLFFVDSSLSTYRVLQALDYVTCFSSILCKILKTLNFLLRYLLTSHIPVV